MNLIPFYKTWQPSSKGTILVVDFRVALFHILYSKPDPYINLMWYWEQYLHQLPSQLGLSKCPLIIVDDYKKPDNSYWRQAYIDTHKSNFSEYKDGRLPKPPIYYELLDAGHLYCLGSSIPVFRQEGIEADDWAGVIYRKKAKDETLSEIILVSTDGDWAQLVNDEFEIRQLCLGSWKQNSRLKDEAEILANKKHPGQVFDTVDDKIINGEKADNLDIGSPREIIDLRSEPPIKINDDGLLAELKNPTFIADTHIAALRTLKINDEKVFKR